MPQTFIQVPNTPKRARRSSKAYQAAYKIERMPSPVSAAQGYDSVYLLAAAIKQAGSTDGRKIKDALENLNEKVDGVITVYDHPFTARPTTRRFQQQHPGVRRGEGRPCRWPERMTRIWQGDKALRIKPRA